MKASTKRHAGPLLFVAAVALGVAAGGCKRADNTSDTGNTSGMSGPATASAASGLTGPAIAPAPAPQPGASQ